MLVNIRVRFVSIHLFRRYVNYVKMFNYVKNYSIMRIIFNYEHDIQFYDVTGHVVVT